MRESMKEKAKRWREAMKSSDSGPLMIAKEVADICDNWEDHKQQADGLTMGEFLGTLFGRGRKAAFWKRLAAAVNELGTDCRRYLHWQTAIWVSQTVQQDRRDAVLKELAAGYNENGKNPLTPVQARRRVRDLLGGRFKRKIDSWREYAHQLEGILTEHGIPVPGMRAAAE